MRDAYRAKGWSFGNPDDIGQCKNDRFLDKLSEQEGEGCNIYGYLEVNKVRTSRRKSRGRPGHRCLHARLERVAEKATTCTVAELAPPST